MASWDYIPRKSIRTQQNQRRDDKTIQMAREYMEAHSVTGGRDRRCLPSSVGEPFRILIKVIPGNAAEIIFVINRFIR